MACSTLHVRVSFEDRDFFLELIDEAFEGVHAEIAKALWGTIPQGLVAAFDLAELMTCILELDLISKRHMTTSIMPLAVRDRSNAKNRSMKKSNSS